MNWSSALIHKKCNLEITMMKKRKYRCITTKSSMKYSILSLRCRRKLKVSIHKEKAWKCRLRKKINKFTHFRARRRNISTNLMNYNLNTSYWRKKINSKWKRRKNWRNSLPNKKTRTHNFKPNHLKAQIKWVQINT